MTGPRHATAEEVPAVSAVLGRAFLDDPVMTYFFPAERGRLRKVEVLLRAAAVRALRAGELWTDDAHAGAAVWSAPGRWQVRGLDIAREARIGPVFGRRVIRALRYLRRVEAAHPREPHWYLAVLGTDPPEQGKGIGSALIAPVLERCDADGIPAFLESSKRANIPFYERHGFTVTDAIEIPGGPTVWGMWRDPQGPDRDA